MNPMNQAIVERRKQAVPIREQDERRNPHSAYAALLAQRDQLVAALTELIENPNPGRMRDPMAAHKMQARHIVAMSKARAALAKVKG